MTCLSSLNEVASAKENGGPTSSSKGQIKERNAGRSSNCLTSRQNLSESGVHKCSHDLENDEVYRSLDDDDGACSSGDVEVPGFVSNDRDGTLSDLFGDNMFDEDDEDGDWDPSHNFDIKKRFCLNCTYPIFGDTDRCLFCKEEHDLEVSGYEDFQAHIEQLSRNQVRTDLSSSTTAIAYDERMLLHYEIDMKSHPHPERPDRIRAIAAALVSAGIFPSKCSLVPAREITKEELLMVHTSDHIDTVELTKNLFSSYFTSDTYANVNSACAARLAAGSCADLASLIVSNRVRNAFALVRPPGHHAGVKEAMGFCLHNNAAVAAVAAQQAGAKKVLIVDWDVHHGNGTQEIFNGSKSVLYISLHRHEGGSFYPGTGAASEVGVGDGTGFSVNIPWSCGGVGDSDYIFAFKHVIVPIALEFSPDITIISAGFDAARGDPLGCCDVTPAGYAQMTRMLNSCSSGKLLAILEGGYNLRSISSSATAVVEALLGSKSNYDMDAIIPSKACLETVLQVLEIQQHFWPILLPTSSLLLSQWKSVLIEGGSSLKKRKHFVAPIWWKWGSKRFQHALLSRKSHSKILRRRKKSMR